MVGDEGLELLPRRGLAVVENILGTIWVVELKDRCLLKRRCGAGPRRVLAVTLDFRRATVMGLDDDPVSDSAQREGRGVVDRLTWNQILDAPAEGQNLLNRSSAGCEPRQAERGRHELEHRAPRMLAELRRILRKFPVEPVFELRQLLELRKAPPVIAPRLGLIRNLHR